MGLAATTPPFNDLVGHAVTAHSNISPGQLIILDNSAKYCPRGINQNSTNEQNLSSVFDTMAKLNQGALENPSLCAGQRGPSFRDALSQAAGELAFLANGRRVRYVELGPEPWKSRALLAKLLEAGVQLLQYIGVDINPKSEETMRRALVPVIGAKRFAYCIADFYKCSADNFPKPNGDTGVQDQCVTVVTNLGFQEGNDLPSRIGPMLMRLTRPGDLLLSEMQVLHRGSGGASDKTSSDTEGAQIKHFYHHPEMRRFSALVGQQLDSRNSPEPQGAGSNGEQGEEYQFHLVPLQTEVGSVKVATTLVSVHVDGAKKYLLTNSCLKYTLEQFRRAREAAGDFTVRAERVTGDKSVVFQIAERR
ncbi:hypothetical protein MMC20_004659 [Loxospora ochrophaea]|nr:hypothetical protein [Loxospora ochrophaea]